MGSPPSEFLGSCLSDYDWLRRWNRLRVCHPEGSKRQVKASARIERLLARSLKEHLHDANPSVANAALKRAFGREIIKWLDTSSIEDTKIVDEKPKLEIIDMRPLDDDEQKRLWAQYPKWSAVIQDSGQAAYCIEVEGQAIREETGSFWRRPRFLKGLGIACATGLSGAVIAGGVLHLYRQQAGSLTTPDSKSSRILDPLSVSTYTPSEVMMYSDTGSEAPMKSYTPITEATTYSYTSLCDAQFSRLSDAERYKYAVSCDCKAWSESELIMDCEFVASDPRAGNVTMSAHELASLRIPSETCKGIYDNKKNASMVGATADAWKTLDWSSCIWGGKVVCVDERGEDLSCHYFYHPFKYDLARVWEAVVRYLKPSRCLITNNAELDANVRQLDFHVRVRGRAAANWINADLPDTWQQKLHNELGLSFSSQRTDPGCSGTYNACQLPKEGCRCIEGRFNADAVGPSEEDVAWGYVTDFFVAAKEMKGNYSLFQALGYSPKSCKFECFNSKIRTISGYRKELIEYWGRANNSFKATPTFTNV